MIRLDELSKRYYSIGEVAKMLSVTTSTIRHWELSIPALDLNKNSKGERRLTVENIEMLVLIHHLVKERGFTLPGVVQELAVERKKMLTRKNLIERLTSVRGRMQNLLDELTGEEE